MHTLQKVQYALNINVGVEEAIEIDNQDVQHQAVEGVVDEGKHHGEGTDGHINV